jgi:hypothetical protein
LHLRELIRRCNCGADLKNATWIVAYPGVKNLLFGLVSAALLPIVAVLIVLQVFQNVPVAAGAMTLLNLAISLLTASAILRVSSHARLRGEP